MGKWETVTIDSNPMQCYMAIPQLGRPGPGVAVLHGGNGFDAVTEQTVDRLASEGVAAIAPDLFHRGSPERPLNGGPRSGSMHVVNFLADVNGVLAHLARLPEVAPERLGLIGFCMGGQTTYLVAGNNPQLRAAVAFYPGFLFNPLGAGQDPAPFDFTPNIQCPLLILHGRDDTNPSPDDVAKVTDRLAQLGKRHEAYAYPGAGHAFMSEGGPSYREAAAKDAWARCVAWLRQYL